MRRREFAAGIAAAAVARPIGAWAQRRARPLVGYLSGRSQADSTGVLDAFRRGLGQLDFVEGRTVDIEYRWAGGRYDRLPGLAAELVQRDVDVILATGGGAPSGLAAKKATATIPIVSIIGGDPVGFGLVQSLNRPGANATGVAFLINLLHAKQVELLHDLVPRAKTLGFIVNTHSPYTEIDLRDAERATAAVGCQLVVAKAGATDELEAAFALLRERNADALVMQSEPLFNSYPQQIVALATRYGLPATYALREYVDAGGLMSYGTSINDAHRLAGWYVGRILKGERPADLPVQQSVKIELIVNLKTAKALGLDVPQTLLARADEVIE
jgi:putative ABC transport system substrate-binding protein